MQNVFGYHLPKKMHPEFGALVKAECDRQGRELSAEELFGVFRSSYLEIPEKYKLLRHSIAESSGENGTVSFSGTLSVNGQTHEITGSGNGPIDAFFQALQELHIPGYAFLSYHEHAITSGSDSNAIAYIELKKPDGKPIFGVGIASNINLASIRGVLNAINRAENGQ